MKSIFRLFKRLLVGIFLLIVAVVIFAFFYVKLDKFGASPEEPRLSRLQESDHFTDGRFDNIHDTPQLTEGYSLWDVTYDYFFNGAPRRRPIDTIPSMKTDLLSLPRDKDVLVWFGHSSYFIQIDGKRVLLDPVFSGNASPVPGTNVAFQGTDRYTANDLPEVDYLVISHDHYDHVDYETLLALRGKTKKVICGLGVGAHFEQWGYTAEQIIERDWHEEVKLDSGFTIHTTPARHFSGRSFSRNNTLWMSYVFVAPSMNFYFGGDSGYDTHFAEIGEKFGPIDLAMIDNGQYDVKWRYVHTLPEEALQAALDLKARKLFPVHSSKFMMANHPWDEPLSKITELNKKVGLPLVTPIIGELVDLKSDRKFPEWWVGLQ